MKETQIAVHRDQARAIAWLALSLFVAGVLLPFVIYPVCRFLGFAEQPAARVAAGFGAVCEVLALTFGVVGRRSLPGKLAAAGSGAIIALVAFAFAAFVFRPAP